jgi:predicted DCC family thiol-disulfide oxidoreductase YuxK
MLAAPPALQSQTPHSPQPSAAAEAAGVTGDATPRTGAAPTPTTVYFDGACPLCSREIAHYRRRDPGGCLRLIDIADPHFDAAAHGLSAERVNQVMHVRRPDGSLATGVDAFIAIWDALPGYGVLSKVAALPGVHLLLRGGYRVFAAVRPYLPRRQVPACHDGSCQV